MRLLDASEILRIYTLWGLFLHKLCSVSSLSLSIVCTLMSHLPFQRIQVFKLVRPFKNSCTKGDLKQSSKVLVSISGHKQMSNCSRAKIKLYCTLSKCSPSLKLAPESDALCLVRVLLCMLVQSSSEAMTFKFLRINPFLTRSSPCLPLPEWGLGQEAVLTLCSNWLWWVAQACCLFQSPSVHLQSYSKTWASKGPAQQHWFQITYLL